MLEACPVSLREHLSVKSHPSSNPRIDLLGPLGNSFYRNSISSIQTLFGKFVLISDNFGVEPFGQRQVVPPEAKFAQIEKMYSNIDDESQREYLINHYTNQYSLLLWSRNSFAKLVSHMVQSNPSVNFVFRPHPVADHSYWFSSLPSARNLTIIFKDNIIPWIKSASCVVHSACTIGLEAELANIPSIDISLLASDERALGVSSHTSRYRPTSYDQLNTALTQCITLPSTTYPNQFVSKDSTTSSLDSNVSALNPLVYKQLDELGIGLPCLSALSLIRNSYLDFQSNHSSTNWRSLASDTLKLSSLCGNQKPLANKSRFYSLLKSVIRLLMPIRL